MAKFNLDYYEGEDQYSDGEIEQTILELVQKGMKLEDMESVEFPIVYHLSKERENVLNWYPFKKNASLLEVGAGCGAITGMLCEKAGKVVAVELSKRRAMINYERHQQYDNLELLVGNFNDIKFQEEFDYIILNGVFEYAASFTEGKTPYESFLKLLSGKLKKDGRILIAIENRLGIKYFSGAAEDHTDSFFLGMNNYEREENVRTFSKQEMIDLCKRTGMVCNRFYYPYPDYKFPNEIYTDRTINSMGYGKDYYNFSNKRFLLYNECAVVESLRKENVADIFANSFLVEICYEKHEDERTIEYVKINSDRRNEFKIGTRIEKEKGSYAVYKYPLHEKAKDHINNMYLHERAIFYGNIKLLAGDKSGEEIKYPFLREDTLSKKVEKAFYDGDRNKIIDILDPFFDMQFSTAEIVDYHNEAFEKIFGNIRLSDALECIRPANIDLTCENTFCVDDTYQVIDGEWIFDLWIPKQFIISRNLNELYGKYTELNELLPKKDLFLHYEIDEKMERVFNSWNRFFTLEYVKANQMERFSIEKKQLSLDEILKKIESQKRICTSLYLDYGEGYQEEIKIYRELLLNENGEFEGVYEIDNPDSVKKMRWDPVESRFCVCMVFAKIGDKNIRLRATNAELVSEGHDVFFDRDPQYEIVEGLGANNEIAVYGSFRYLDEQSLLNFLQEQKARSIKKDNYIVQIEDASRKMQYEMDRLSKELGKVQQEKENVENILSIMENSRGWRLLEKLRKVKRLMGR